MHKNLSIDALQPGMVIVQITAQNGPVKIRKSGLVTSSAMIQGLREMGVLEVEIDPAQTVELAEEGDARITHSPTKSLLMQDSSRNQVDNQLSDQFHRSLFLPSVQSLPDSWHYYSRKIAMAALVFTGGLGLGWTIANYPLWLTLLKSQPSTEAVSTPAADSAVAADIQPTPVNVDTSALADASADSRQKTQNNPAAPEPAQNRDSEQPGTSASDRQLNTEDDDGGELVRAEDLSPAAEDISPELLDKFRQAVSALDDTDNAAPEPEVEPPQEVVRVDQLPSWVLAELPSLSFSAHMFASDAADRWVRVNGQELKEGDWLDDNLRIVSIQSQHVILAYKGQEFSMRALTDW
jgi:general secretion pathway protein B